MLVRRNPNNQAIAIGEFVNYRFTNSPLPLALPLHRRFLRICLTRRPRAADWPVAGSDAVTRAATGYSKGRPPPRWRVCPRRPAHRYTPRILRAMAASAQYSVTVRVELDARKEPLGKLTAQIARPAARFSRSI